MRLIDADALMDALGIADDCQDCQYQSSIFCSRSPDFVNACEAIADAPVIDAVPVVRCRYCKWYDKHDKRCKVWNHGVLSIGYCYRGEEREDETVD